MGTYVSNRGTDKLTRISDKIYCCRSGSAADTQAIAEIVSSHMDILSLTLDQAPRVNVAAATTRELIYNYRDSLMAGMMVAGWDEQNGGQVYSLPIGGMLVRQKVALGGSGSTYIWGHMD